MSVYLKRINRANHPSGTSPYDDDGRERNPTVWATNLNIFSTIKVMTMKRENTSAFLYTHTTSQMYITICMTQNYTKHKKNIHTHLVCQKKNTIHNHPAKLESLNNYMILHGFFNFRIQSFQKEPLNSNHGDPLRTTQSCRLRASSINLA